MNARNEIAKTVAEVRAFLEKEIARAKRSLKDGKWCTILVGVTDQSELTVHPCRLLLPFHYPATVEELDAEHPSHFEFAENILKDPIWRPDEAETGDSDDMRFAQQVLGNYAFASFRNAPRIWSVRNHAVSLFEKLYENAASKEGRKFVKASDRQMEVQLSVLRQAAAEFDPKRTIIGIESESEEWWEVLTFHIHGPLIPPPPPPVSDVQLLCRLRRQTHNYIGKSAFTIKRGKITEVHLDGACTTDATIDLLRRVKNLRPLCAGLKKISLRSTLVTKKSLDFLRSELPHVKVLWSYHPDY